jgi:hypothetical protein
VAVRRGPRSSIAGRRSREPGWRWRA